MKLLAEFNLSPRDSDYDVNELCVGIRDHIESYLMSLRISWDKVRVSELRSDKPIEEPKGEHGN